MEKQELVNAVKHILNTEEELEIVVYAVPVGSEDVFKVNIAKVSMPGLIEVFRKRIDELLCQPEYKIYDFSLVDNRNDGYYLYDIAEVPEKMKSLEIVIAKEYPLLNVVEHPIKTLDHLIVVLSDGKKPITLYKKLHIGDKIYKSPHIWMGRYGGENSLETIDSELLRISGNFDVLYANSKYIILNDGFAEKEFNMMSILKKESASGLNQVGETNLLKDVNKLTSYSKTNAFARKLVKTVKKSNVVKAINDGKITKEDVFLFIDKVPELKAELRVVGKKTKYISVNNRSQANAFLDLLNDDFLISELTQVKYIANNKDPRKK